MEQPGLNGHHRHKDGEISCKHGDTLIGTLRRVYSPGFAKGAIDAERLKNVLARLDEGSLSRLVHDHEHGHLEGKISWALPPVMSATKARPAEGAFLASQWPLPA
jgi:hypothetical protein